MVVHDVSNGLRVGSRAGPAAPDRIVHLGQFVGDAVGDVRASRSAGVGAENDTFGECDGHAGGEMGLEDVVIWGGGSWNCTLKFLDWRGADLVK